MMNDPVSTSFPVVPFGTITYVSDGTVSWTRTGTSNPNIGESLSFVFDGDGSVFSAVMLIAPKLADAPASPFNQANPIQLCQTGEDVFVSPPIVANGKWGFTVSFLVPGDSTGTNTVTADPSFYFLPDPELSVGPGTVDNP